METLLKASILFLDDQTQYLTDTKQFFRDKGLEITTAQNCEKVLEEGQKGSFDIILSDLDLNNISKIETGLTVLEKIRELNDTVFLGLYTAYEYTIKQSDRNRIEEKNIKVYSKQDPDAFWGDLVDDYENHQKNTKKDKEELTKIVFYEAIKKDVLNHLNSISNQKILVPISKIDQDFTVKDLYQEVLAGSKIGKMFMMDWYENIKFINELKNKKRNGK